MAKRGPLKKDYDSFAKFIALFWPIILLLMIFFQKTKKDTN